jgi:hypothetical protein
MTKFVGKEPKDADLLLPPEIQLHIARNSGVLTPGKSDLSNV